MLSDLSDFSWSNLIKKKINLTICNVRVLIKNTFTCRVIFISCDADCFGVSCDQNRPPGGGVLFYLLKKIITPVHSQKSNPTWLHTEPGVCVWTHRPQLCSCFPSISAVALQSFETLTFDGRSGDLSRLKQAPLLAVVLLSHLM